MCIWDTIKICRFVHLHKLLFLFCFTHVQQKLSTFSSKSYPLFQAKNYIAMLTESFRVSMTY